MTIPEAMRQVSDEYNAEVYRAREDKPFGALLSGWLVKESIEIDEELPHYVSAIGAALGLPAGTALPDYVYQMARMCFRFGMRTQRKMDSPEKPTSVLWRGKSVVS